MDIFIIFFILLTLCFYFHLFKKYKRTSEDLSKIYLAIKRLRYGNLHIRLENLNDKCIQNTVNRLFETIYDREIMIKEYQNTLSSKNLSLTEIIKQEQNLKQIKDDFAATLTHDMKVPVIAELNSIEYLLNGHFGELNPKQSEILELMKSSNLELKKLIENILEVYRTEQQEIKLNIQKINLNEFLNNTINEVKTIAMENNISIELQSNKTTNLELNIDPFHLKRVVKNLLQNAIYFSNYNNKIEIITNCFESQVQVSVTNSGASISKEDIELIFNKYYIGYSKFKKSGTGLGLYIAKQIMIAHNGDIEVDTSKTGYTTFILKFFTKPQ